MSTISDDDSTAVNNYDTSENSGSTSTAERENSSTPLLLVRPRPPPRPPLDKNGHLLQHTQLKFKTGQQKLVNMQNIDKNLWSFTPDEDNIIRNNWDEFREKHSLSGHIFEYTGYDLVDGLVEKRTLDPETFLWPSLCKGLPNRNATVVRRRIFHIFDKFYKPDDKYDYLEMKKWLDAGGEPEFVSKSLKIPLSFIKFDKRQMKMKKNGTDKDKIQKEKKPPRKKETPKRKKLQLDPETRIVRQGAQKICRLKRKLKKEENEQKREKIEEEIESLREEHDKVVRKRFEERETERVAKRRSKRVEEEMRKIAKEEKKDLVSVTQIKDIQVEIEKQLDKTDDDVQFKLERGRLIKKRVHLNRKLKAAETEEEKEEIEEKLKELQRLLDELYKARDEQLGDPVDIMTGIRRAGTAEYVLRKRLAAAKSEEEREDIERRLVEATTKKAKLLLKREKNKANEKFERGCVKNAMKQYKGSQGETVELDSYFRTIRYLYKSSKTDTDVFIPENFDWNRFEQLFARAGVDCPSVETVMRTFFQKFHNFDIKFFRYLRPIPNLKERIMIVYEALARKESSAMKEQYRLGLLRNSARRNPVYNRKLIFEVIYEHYKKNNDNWKPPQQLMKYADDDDIERIDSHLEEVQEVRNQQRVSLTPLATPVGAAHSPSLTVRTVPSSVASDRPKRRSVRFTAARRSILDISAIEPDTSSLLITVEDTRTDVPSTSNVAVAAAPSASSPAPFNPNETILAGGGNRKRTKTSSPAAVAEEMKVSGYDSLIIQIDEIAKKRRLEAEATVRRTPTFQPDESFSNIWDQLNAI